MIWVKAAEVAAFPVRVQLSPKGKPDGSDYESAVPGAASFAC